MKRFLAVLFLALPLAFAQQQAQVRLLDGATATGAGKGVDFTKTGFYFHVVTIGVTGAPSGCTFEFEESDDDGVADAYADATEILGTTNPFTCTSPGVIVFAGFKNFFRGNLSALSGGTNPAVTAVLTSFPLSDAGAAFSMATGTNATQVQGTAAVGAANVGNPVRIAGTTAAGNVSSIYSLDNTLTASLLTPGVLISGVGSQLGSPLIACDQIAQVNVAAAATAVIVTGVASRRIFVCGGWLSITAAGTYQWQEATTAGACASPTNLTPAVNITTTGVAFGSGLGMFLKTITAAKDLCLASVTGTTVGWISYAVVQN